MADLPEWALRHTLTAEPYLGRSIGGDPLYGPPVQVRCLIDRNLKEINPDEIRVEPSGARIYTQLDAPINSETRLTVEGRRVEIVTLFRRDGGGLPTPDHLEIIVH